MRSFNCAILFAFVVGGFSLSSAALAGCNSGNVAASNLLNDPACQATATGSGSAALGLGAVANGDSQISIGTNAGAATVVFQPFNGPNGGSTFVGVQAGANGAVFNQLNTAIGLNAGTSVIGNFNVAVGDTSGSQINASSTVSIGEFARASQNGNVAIGNLSVASGATVGFNSSSTAVGDHAFAGDSAFFLTPFMNSGTTALGAFSQAGATGLGQTNATAVGFSATANIQNATAIGQGSNASALNSVALGAGSIANQANTVSLGIVGGERRAVNVAAGIIASGSTDAVNGGQLFTANQRVAAAFGGGAGLDAGGQLTAPSYLVQGTAFNNVGGALGALDTQVSTINNNGTKYYQSNSVGPGASATGTNALAMGTSSVSSGTNAIAIGTGSLATQSGSIAVGINSASTGTNAIAIGTGASATGSVAVGVGASAANGGAAFGDGAVATGINSTATGPGATATHANSVAIGSGSVTSAPNTVSVGSAGNERRITNVAAGINPTDAVNVSQISGVASGFQSQIGVLQNQITDNRREARQGVAAAFALTSAPMPSAPGKVTYAVNTGFFRSETAGGVSFAYRFDTARPMALNVGYAYGGDNSHGGRVGVAGEF